MPATADGRKDSGGELLVSLEEMLVSAPATSEEQSGLTRARGCFTRATRPLSCKVNTAFAISIVLLVCLEAAVLGLSPRWADEDGGSEQVFLNTSSAEEDGGWYKKWGWRAEAVFYSGSICFLVALICTYLVAATGELICFDEDSKETVLSVDPSCTMNVLMQVAVNVQVNITKAQLQDASVTRRRTSQSSFMSVHGILMQGGGLVLSCLNTRCCCRSVRTDIPRALDSIFDALVAHRLERCGDRRCEQCAKSQECERQQSRAMVVRQLQKRLIDVFTDQFQASHDRRIALPHLTHDLILAALNVHGMEDEIAHEAILDLPDMIKSVLGHKIKDIIKEVWQRLRVSCFQERGHSWRSAGATRPTHGTELKKKKLAEALKAKTRTDTGEVEFTTEEFHTFDATRLSEGHFIQVGDEYFHPVGGHLNGAFHRELYGLLNALVEYRTIAHVKKWWTKMLWGYFVWLLVLSISCMVMVSASTQLFPETQVGGSWAWFIGGLTALVLTLLLQVRVESATA